MACDGVEQQGQEELTRLEFTRTCNSGPVELMEVISKPSGNGSKGVVGIPLHLFLSYDKDSVASSQEIFQAFTKKVHDPQLRRR
jgi:hypothetical protein